MTHDEGIDDVHDDRKAADDQREPKGPDPIARSRRDGVSNQGTQEGSQTTDGELQTDGDGQVLCTEPFG